MARERGGRRWEYRWSAENRLVAVRTPEGATWQYRYDAFGNTVSGYTGKARFSSTDAQAVAVMFSNPGPDAKPLPAAALTTDVAVLTALANDVSFDVVFARSLAANGRAGDIALGLSTSGGSENVLRGFAEATRRGMLTIGLAGYDGGKMAEAGTIDHLFVMPSASVHRIQEAQTTTYHVLWELTQLALQAVAPR